MRNVDVCLTPELLSLYGVEGKVVVVVDILRATSCMTTAFAHGINSIVPVATLEEGLKLQRNGYIGAGERDGKTAKGFSMGNSPFSYMDPSLKGKDIAMTTTNGTKAISVAKKDAEEVIVGSFLNLGAIINYLLIQPHDVLVLCAGWKGRINLEDTLFAGAVIEGLQSDYECEHDASITSRVLYQSAKSDMKSFLACSSHARRLNRLDIKKDIEFCLKIDEYNVIPKLTDDKLVKMQTITIGG